MCAFIFHMMKALFITFFLIGLAVVFEHLPAVQQARAAFPESWGADCGCGCVLKSRPWYGRLNPWFWLWVVSVPVLVFSTLPAAPARQRAGRHVLAVLLSYAVICVTAVKVFEIRNAPFDHPDITTGSGALDVFKFGCYASDGMLYALALFFGWLPAMLYAGWWEIIWHQYHKRMTRQIDAHFRRDWISRIVVFISIAVPVAFVAAKLYFM